MVTFHRVYNEVLVYYESAIDITICFPNLPAVLSWERSLSSAGSDHLPVIITVTGPEYRNNQRQRKQINRKKALLNIAEIVPARAFSIEEYENNLSYGCNF